MRLIGWRTRGTGPCHPLAKVKCHHGPAFTLYSPGYAPFQRELAAPVSSAGELVRVGLSESEASSTTKAITGELAWSRTIFNAALDASRGESWSRESPAEDSRRRRTQRRHIALTAILLGLSAEVEEDKGQRIAGILGIAYLVLFDLRQIYQSASTYQGYGAVIVEALELIPVDRTLDKRLMTAGYIAELWGKPKRWDPG